MIAPGHTIVSASRIGGVLRLQPLVERIFDRRDGRRRASGWFARKCAREHVETERSRVCLTADGTPVGYALLSALPSWGVHARTGGVGLLPDARGRGLGRALVESLCTHARARTVTIPCAPDRKTFFARIGFTEVGRTQTWLTFGRGRAPMSADPPQAWATGELNMPVHARWLAEAWAQACTSGLGYTLRVRDGRDRFDVSREGTAHVAFRWCSHAHTPAEVADGAVAWAAQVPGGAPVVLHEIPAGGPLPAALNARGWVHVQTTVAMRKRVPLESGL